MIAHLTALMDVPCSSASAKYLAPVSVISLDPKLYAYHHKLTQNHYHKKAWWYGCNLLNSLHQICPHKFTDLLNTIISDPTT